MRYYPINLDIAGKLCTVVGGGAVAERKAQTLLAADAAVVIVSPQLTPVLAELAAGGRVGWRQRVWQQGDLAGSFLVICATNDEKVNSAVAAEAREIGALVNVADTPSLCDFTLPALVNRGDLLITISTGGMSPIISRRIREHLEQLYGEEFGDYLAELAGIRNEMKQCLDTPADRENFWRLALDLEVLELVRQGKAGEAKEKMIRAISRTWS